MTHRLALSWLPGHGPRNLAIPALPDDLRTPAGAAFQEDRHSATSLVCGSDYASGLTIIVCAESMAAIDTAYARIVRACQSQGHPIPLAHGGSEQAVAQQDEDTSEHSYLGYFVPGAPLEGEIFGDVQMLSDDRQNAPGAMHHALESTNAHSARQGETLGRDQVVAAAFHGLSRRQGRDDLLGYAIGKGHLLLAGGSQAFGVVMRYALRHAPELWSGRQLAYHRAGVACGALDVVSRSATGYLADIGRGHVLRNDVRRLYQAAISSFAAKAGRIEESRIRLQGETLWLAVTTEVYAAYRSDPSAFDFRWADTVTAVYGVSPACLADARDDVQGWRPSAIAMHEKACVRHDMPLHGLKRGDMGFVASPAPLERSKAWVVEFRIGEYAAVLELPAHELILPSELPASTAQEIAARAKAGTLSRSQQGYVDMIRKRRRT